MTTPPQNHVKREQPTRSWTPDRPPRILERSRLTLDTTREPRSRDIVRDERTTIVKGSKAEQRAAELLERSGLRIVERNYWTKLGELDIIAREGSTLVFVEVRSRRDATHGSALETVDWRKQRKVTRVAMQYIKWRRPVFVAARFDVVGITGDEIVHIRDAWRLQGY
jgi:putative endonuclease